MSTYRKKLIEVSLPLEAINAAAAAEKAGRLYGHPRNLHLWWARRPHAACRAILFAQLVDDPSSCPEVFTTEEAQNRERQRLFRLIERLVPWESTKDEEVTRAARLEIARSHARRSSSPKARPILAADVTARAVDEYLSTELPPIHDPFAGGGTIPLEAQRLGLRAIASDLNPVAVMINKALIEIPPKYAGLPPVNRSATARLPSAGWRGARGLAEDVRFYGTWMREQAIARVGHLYPQAVLPKDRGGGHAKVVAWIWARTVESPNPAFRGRHVPLMSSFWLCSKPGNESWADPVVEGKSYRFEIRRGKPKHPDAVGEGTKLGRGANFRCVLSNTPIQPDYIKSEAVAKRMGARMVAVVAEVTRGRLYLAPTPEMEAAAEVSPEWIPEDPLPNDPRNFWTVQYGLTRFGDLFTGRQLATLTTFSNLVSEARQQVIRDARSAGRDEAYADAVAVYLAFCVSAIADDLSSIVTWRPSNGTGSTRSTFARQSVPMTWDFAEANPFANSAGDIESAIESIAMSLDALPIGPPGIAVLADAASIDFGQVEVSTDPPYFDNIGYADLSDFFYLWLRRSLQSIFPESFATVLVPKEAELIAAPYRHGGKVAAEQFFMTGMRRAMKCIGAASSESPTTIYYAFKQREGDTAGASSSGWETFLEALNSTGFVVDGTWPVRTERAARSTGLETNVLASSIVLVCRKRPENAPSTTRGEFRRLLRRELPDALRKLQQGNIAPVDVAQASIGPGMAIFSRHSQVLEADGQPMSVRAALQLINEVLDEYLSSGEGDFDAETRFAITWYEQHGWAPGPFGDAETLAKARNVSVAGVVEAGICHGAAGKVRILKRSEMRPLDYDPALDKTPTVWEFAQHMIRYLEEDGEEAAARLLTKLGSAGDATRELAYRLFNTCERRKWTEDARSYNGLILAWPELEKLAAKLGEEAPPPTPSKPGKKNGKKAKAAPKKKAQQQLFDGDEE